MDRLGINAKETSDSKVGDGFSCDHRAKAESESKKV